MWSVGATSWIRRKPAVEERGALGYVRPGSTVQVESLERVPGRGCPRGFYRVRPRGYLCADRTVSESPEPGWREAAIATRGAFGAWPYRYAISDGTPMYGRVPTPDEQARRERWLGPPGEGPKLAKTLRSHEELAMNDTISSDGPLPFFLAGGRSVRRDPHALVARTMPLGSMLSFTRSFEAEGRTWLLSTDHTLVPADRVRPFRQSEFHGVALDREAGPRLPIAWFRQRERPRFVEENGVLAARGAFPVRSWAEPTGREREQDGTRYLEVRDPAGTPGFVRADDATIVAAVDALETGVSPGQKWILIRLQQGTLVAYEGLRPVFATLVSPGAGGVPTKGRDPVKDSTTPLGSYAITFKDRAATMSPELREPRSFWIQDVPFTQYFNAPFAIHAAYWHERFGEYVSAGCVNASPLDAERLFAWSDPPVPNDWQGVAGAGAPENGPTTIVVVRR